MLYSALFKFTPTTTNKAHSLINKEAFIPDAIGVYNGTYT